MRALQFWAESIHNIIVVDGSKNPLSASSIPRDGDNISYYHLPVTWGERLSFAASKVETDYVVMVSDDEYYIPSCLEKSVQFLDLNKDYVACVGRCLGFYYRSGKVYGRQVYPQLRDYEVVAKDASARVVYHMENYVMSLLWAVTRTSAWRSAADTYAREEFRVYCQAELQFEMILSFAGKSRVIPELGWLRSLGENDSIVDLEPGLDSSSPMDIFSRDSGRAHEFQRFVNVMSDTFYSLGCSDFKHSRNTVISGVEAYVRFLEKSRKNRKIYLGLARYLPKSIKNFLRRVLSLLLRNESVSLVSAARSLELEGVSVDFSNIDKVEKSLLSFYRDR